MAKTDPDGTGFQRTGAFMGQRRAVQSCPDRDSLFPQYFCGFFTVAIRQK